MNGVPVVKVEVGHVWKVSSRYVSLRRCPARVALPQDQLRKLLIGIF